MIDTDKYGNEQTIGSKEFEEYLHHRMDKEFCNDIACGDMNKELALQYANEFFGYALDLQEEVKRLREGMKDMLYRLEMEERDAGHAEQELEQWIDTWKHWLKEMIE